MKSHLAFKFLAVVLCAFFLTAAVASAAGVIVLMNLGLYGGTVEEVQEQLLRSDLHILANKLAVQYAARETNCPQDLIYNYLDYYYDVPSPSEDQWYYTITDSSGNVVSSGGSRAVTESTAGQEFPVTPNYPSWVDHSTSAINIPLDNNTPLWEEELLGTVGPILIDGTFRFSYWDESAQLTHTYELEHHRGDAYLVTLYLLPDAYELQVSYDWELMAQAYSYRYYLFIPLVLGLLLTGACATFLCSIAGRKPGSEEVRPGGLNRLPLDVYLGLCVGAVVLLVVFYSYLFDSFSRDTALITALCIGVTGFLGCVLVTGFVFACAAQFRLENGFWWRHSALRSLLRLCRRVLGNLWHVIRKVWQGVRWLLRRIMDLLPLTWQILLWALLMGGGLMLSVLSGSPWLIGITVVCCMAVVLYAAHSFGVLMESARRMSQGDLDTKVDSDRLMGGFARFATHLNALADVAVAAARKQMRSERMKAELVTNVSHDIKTPLTSIINYVDLLKRAESREEEEACLEVLGRQSQRMKKLIDDLMELSKASSGTMTVEIQRADAAETVTQALGEFADKLEQADLVPIFESPGEPVYMLCDGRLTWRVLSNLLSNAVKYALPGTRLYVDLAVVDDTVLISLKNISREQLNVSSEELLERFVRGDASRNTEGSGLGLNIAQSLMELQRGQFRLLVDGDLFKATLVFPRASETEQRS